MSVREIVIHLTYRLTVSESPIMQRWRFGLVIATIKERVNDLKLRVV